MGLGVERVILSAYGLREGLLFNAMHRRARATDNSAARVLDNMEKAAAWGAEVAVVAAPDFFLNATPARLLGHPAPTLVAGEPANLVIFRRGLGPENGVRLLRTCVESCARPRT